MRRPLSRRALVTIAAVLLAGATAAVALVTASADRPVRLEVGDDFRSVVAAHPPGTTFVVAAGVHREQSVEVRSGDVFRGEEGAILHGARVLTDFRRVGDRWVGPSPTTLDPTSHGDMEPGWEREALPHDVWVDNTRLRHVPTPEDVGPGTFHLDYGQRRLTLGEDPAGRVVEIALTRWAFAGRGMRDVAFSDLEFRRYATNAQVGPIDASQSHEWTVTRIVSREHHGAGLRVGSGTQVTDCVLADNGHIGLSGGEQDPTDRPITVTGCEVHGNGQLGFDWRWESGGVKFVETTGTEFVDNDVHDNDGVGVWFDIDNRDALIADNRVRANSISGIFYEISDRGRIVDNVVEGNGFGDPVHGGGILVSNSAEVLVEGNRLEGNVHEVYAVHGTREAGDVVRETTGLVVRDNHIVVSGSVGVYASIEEERVYDPATNRFESNHYVLAGCVRCFEWRGAELDVEGWQAAGQDVDSTFEVAGS